MTYHDRGPGVMATQVSGGHRLVHLTLHKVVGVVRPRDDHLEEDGERGINQESIKLYVYCKTLVKTCNFNTFQV